MSVRNLFIESKSHMKLKLLVASLLSTAAIGAMAQSSPFEGAYGQVGIGYESASPSLSFTNIAVGSGSQSGSVPISSTAAKRSSFAGTITTGYNFGITDKFLLGVGAEFSPIEGRAGSYTVSTAAGSASSTWKKQNSFNLFISPATPVGQGGLLYSKFGYTGASAQATATGNNQNYQLHGFSAGLGYKQVISGGLYGFGEINYAKYSNQSNTYSASSGGATASTTSTIGLSAGNALLGVGYNF